MSNSLQNQIKALVKAGDLKTTPAVPASTKRAGGATKSTPGKTLQEEGGSSISRKKRRNQKKKKAKVTGPQYSSETMRSAYGGPSPQRVAETAPVTHREETKPVIRLGTDLNKAWVPNALTETPLIEHRETGIATAMNAGASDFEQIQLGFDFGTSSVKVVARLDSDNSLIPIHFRKGPDALVLPSRLFIDQGFGSLDPLSNRPDGQEFVDLKLPLLTAEVDQASLIRASLFLALVIRRVRAYIYENYTRVLSNKQIFWLINFGVPASFQDEGGLQARFRDIFDCAAYLAVQPAERLKVSDAGNAWLARSWEKKSYTETAMTMVQLVPEIAAQIYAIMRSEQWDSTTRLFTVIDVGAGTVDIGVVSVTGKTGDHHLSFFYTEVVNHGAAMLNRYRIKRIKNTVDSLTEKQSKYLDAVANNTAIDKQLPVNWAGYIRGSQRVSGSFDPDYEFADGYMDDVLKSRDQVLGDGGFSKTDWREHRVILCGGGRNEPLYLKSLEKMTNIAGSNIGFDVRIPRRSREVESAGISQGAYERISVAYGLSFSFELYPQLTLPNQIPQFTGRERPPRFTNLFVGKDSV